MQSLSDDDSSVSFIIFIFGIFFRVLLEGHQHLQKENLGIICNIINKNERDFH